MILKIFKNSSASYPKERFLKATINNIEDLYKKQTIRDCEKYWETDLQIRNRTVT